nr:GyrI-like domain-containing protein [Paraburkholderia sp. ZP32-5]
MKPSTERDYRRRIARVVETILLEPGAPHTLESLAAVAHLSPYHFHRVYRAVMGESVVETVKRLRLAEAAQRLTDAAQVTAVAHDAGYDSAQAFARAFRGFAGVSPSEFRARQRHLVAHPGGEAAVPGASSLFAAPPASSARRRAKRACAATRNASGVPDLPAVEVSELAPLDVLSLRHDGPVATIGQTFRTLMTMLRCTDDSPLHQRVGICVRDGNVPGGFRYHAGIAGVPDARLDDVRSPPAQTETEGHAEYTQYAQQQVEPLRLAGGLYAVHRLVGPYALISPTFRALYSGWLPRSGYARDQRPALELYRSAPDVSPRHTCITDLLIPIRKD